LEQEKLEYTNDTQCLYGVCQNLLTVVAPKRLDGTIVEYLGILHALLHEFNELLPSTPTPSQEVEQRSKFFMLLDLHGLLDDYSHVCDKILGSPIVCNFTSTCFTLMRVPSKHTTDITPHVDDYSTLVFYDNARTRPHKPSKRRHKCDHCGKLGHKIDRCYALQGRPPKSLVVAQIALVQPSTVDHTSFDTPSQPVIFNEFLKWYEDRQNPGSTAFVAHSGTSFVGLTHFTSLSPWVLDSGATYQITSNKYFFSSLSTTGYLPLVTMANGYRVPSHGVGTINIFPSLSIDNVLYVPRFPFNLLSISYLTRSLDCVISFTKDFVSLQDQSSRWMIGIRCESHGLYQLQISAHVGTIMDSTSLIHFWLGHPSLVKMQQLVPSLSNVSSLSCESCQLGKHIRSYFPTNVSQRASFLLP